MTGKSHRTIGYLRVSIGTQDLKKNRAEILAFANEKDLGRVEFVEETTSGRMAWRDRKIATVLHGLGADDILIVSELSRIGRSMLDCMEILAIAAKREILAIAAKREILAIAAKREILAIAAKREIRVYAIKGNWHLDETIQSKIMAMVFSMAAEIERGLISARTKEALRARRASGLPVGRPKGPGKSKLDKHRPEIEAVLANGSTQKFIAKRYNSSPANLANWLKRV